MGIFFAKYASHKKILNMNINLTQMYKQVRLKFELNNIKNTKKRGNSADFLKFLDNWVYR
jgi:hypothetical protein